FKPIAELSLEDWDATMGVNVRSLYLVTRSFLKGMVDAGGGTIVNVASLAGKNGVEGGTAYCASKHAVLGFSKALMLEVRRHNVRVVAICPGSVDTGFRESRANRARVLTADDVAHAVLATLTVPDRAMISEVDIRPTNPYARDVEVKRHAQPSRKNVAQRPTASRDASVRRLRVTPSLD